MHMIKEMKYGNSHNFFKNQFANLSKFGKQLAKFLSLSIVVVEIVKNWGGNGLMKKLQPDFVNLNMLFFLFI